VSAMKHVDPDDRARTAAIDFTRRLARDCREALETELIGAYLIGSLAHAGFSRRYSDVDIALVTESGLSRAGARSPAKHRRGAIRRLGTEGLDILGRSIFCARPISAARSR
jgi:predicted nucleotidyltransferase